MATPTGKKSNSKTVRKPIKKTAVKTRAVAKKMTAGGNGAFKLTYATMFDPPELLHTNFEKALAKVKAELGQDHAMIINGQDRYVEAKFEDRSPINTDWVLGTFQKGGAQDAQDALVAARAAWPKWAGMKWQDRVPPFWNV